MSKPCEIFYADVRDPSQLGESVTRTTVQDAKVTSILWGPLDETVVTGHDNGKLTLWDLKVHGIPAKCINQCVVIITYSFTITNPMIITRVIDWELLTNCFQFDLFPHDIQFKRFTLISEDFLFYCVKLLEFQSESREIRVGEDGFQSEETRAFHTHTRYRIDKIDRIVNVYILDCRH